MGLAAAVPPASGARAPGEPIRVLIVDDSVVIRRLVTLALDEDPSFKVVGVAANGSIALQKIPQVSPDVLTMDIEMPEMGGLATLREVKRLYPRIRVVMFSTLTQRGGRHTLDALSLGADDYVTKAANAGSLDTSLGRLRGELIPKIKQFFEMSPAPAPPAAPRPAAPPRPRSTPVPGRVDVVAIGVSTGGPNALAEIFPSFPADMKVPIVLTQHMPPMFTRLLAERLESRSKLRVREAEEGLPLEPGAAVVAPGDYHLRFKRRGGQVVCARDQGPQENSCRPSVDVMFRSVAEVYGGRALAVILTGMGKDGLRGIETLRPLGSPVIAQDRATSVVWGMPGYVVEAGLADSVVGLGEIASEILRLVG